MFGVLNHQIDPPYHRLCWLMFNQLILPRTRFLESLSKKNPSSNLLRRRMMGKNPIIQWHKTLSTKLWIHHFLVPCVIFGSTTHYFPKFPILHTNIHMIKDNTNENTPFVHLPKNPKPHNKSLHTNHLSVLSGLYNHYLHHWTNISQYISV